MIQKIVFAFLLLVSVRMVGQDTAYSGDPDASYFAARELAFAGKRKTARDTLKKILIEYPEYTDVRSLLAKTYSWDQEYDTARLEFNRITSKERENLEAWIGSIKNEQYAKNYLIALGLTNKALSYLPENESLSNLKEEILQQIADQQLLQNVLKKTKIEEERNQSMTVYTQAEVFDKELDAMYYGAMEYQKKTKWGGLLSRLNYQRRFNINGIQGEVDAYPRFSKTLSGYFNYGYSGAPIFPKHRIGGELVKELPKAMEASLGFRHLIFDQDDATILTGTFGLYRGNYYAVLRPYVIPSAKKGLGLSGNMLLRKYLRDGNNFWGVNLVYGFDTELNQFIINGQLLAETLLYLESQRLRLEYQFTNKKGNNQYKVNIGANRQELAFSTGNFFFSVTAGLAYQVKFR
ncbi:YaiO family outer membrane beta-barrel protein [Maribacter cobaltidurans]|uniref:YaiO beta-barrel domain-containing protein n=1 Tax=Maribacter cobaltidurans TaxID=1178778 RepID=A0A223V9V5_9FLAO|nr:YaiO family outer membrane beta-barrel protein [Maribacter cobaltidurans]ASV32194.1 hypothetical protein CJ263_19280 [Maribacter cobaltidurans]